MTREQIMKCPKCKSEMRLLSMVNELAPLGFKPIYTYVCENQHKEIVIPDFPDLLKVK